MERAQKMEKSWELLLENVQDTCKRMRKIGSKKKIRIAKLPRT